MRTHVGYTHGLGGRKCSPSQSCGKIITSANKRRTNVAKDSMTSRGGQISDFQLLIYNLRTRGFQSTIYNQESTITTVRVPPILSPPPYPPPDGSRALVRSPASLDSPSGWLTPPAPAFRPVPPRSAAERAPSPCPDAESGRRPARPTPLHCVRAVR